jgi:hypothetical protein
MGSYYSVLKNNGAGLSIREESLAAWRMDFRRAKLRQDRLRRRRGRIRTV